MCLSRDAYFPMLLYTRLVERGVDSDRAEAVARKVQRRTREKAAREGLERASGSERL